MRVRIVRKLADRVDGIDLTHFDVGEVIELPEMDGRLIVAERWGEFARREADLNGRGTDYGMVQAIDRRQSSRDLYERLRHKREEYEWRDRRHISRRTSDVSDAPTSAS